MAPKTSTVICSLLLLPGTIAAGSRVTRRTDGDDEGATWTYRRTSTTTEQPYGPSNWYLGYEDCGKDAQSPIDISASGRTSVVKPSEFDLELFPSECASNELSFIADDHSWEVGFGDCSGVSHLSFDGDTYNLAQMHVHSPSEHSVSGSLHAVEIHLVHLREGTDDDILVVGAFFDDSEYGTNTEIQQLWDVLSIGEERTDEDFATHAYGMLPPNPSFSHYTGSLTTPPCSEGVKWLLMNDALIMSKTQVQALRTSVALADDSKVDEQGNTNRPVQPLNGRELFFVKA